MMDRSVSPAVVKVRSRMALLRKWIKMLGVSADDNLELKPGFFDRTPSLYRLITN